MKIDRLGLFLTRQCNFRCVYCCTQTGRDPQDKMTLDELKNLLLQAKHLGAKRIVIVGEGEPLLDDNFFPLLEYTYKLGLGCDLSSNISLVDKKVAQLFFSNGIRVFAKLNSLNPSVQDKLAGKTHCHEWVDYSVNGKSMIIPQALKNLLNAGYGTQYSRTFRKKLLVVETVITTLNINDIQDIVKFCRLCGLGVYIEKLLPPTSKTFGRDLIPSKEQELELYKRVLPLMDWESRLFSKLRCPFETEPFIDINGNIRFCFCIDKSVGNIRNKSLAELHSEQLKLKNKFGTKSPLFRFRAKEFRDCRSRRLLRNECHWQC